MQPEFNPKFRCVICTKQTSVIRHISAVGTVCTHCHRPYALFSRLMDFAEQLTCDPADAQSVDRFRSAIRVLQRIGQEYKVLDTGGVRQLEIVVVPSRRKQVLKNFLKEEQAVSTLLREHEPALSPAGRATPA